MVSKPRILILTASYGEGHLQAAAALAETIQRRRDPFRVQVVDYMEMVQPMLNAMTRFGYKNSVKYVPKLYGMFYRATNKIHTDSALQQLVRRLGAQKLSKYLRSTQPLAVINTFPLSAGSLSWLKQQRQTNIISATVITDYTVHSQWVHNDTDYYYVGSECVKESLLDRGISPDQIEVTGIPIRQSFYQSYDQRHLKQTLGLDNRPVALVMGGWHGVFNARLCERLARMRENVQLLFVCGGDRQLFHRILPLQMQYPDRIRVFGYVSNVPELMSTSDFILTKAGGLTTTESLAMSLPMLLYRPIPGQEEENARFLTREGAACLARDEKELFEKFATLCSRPKQLTHMKQHAERIKSGDASSAIVKSMLQKIDTHHQKSPTLEPPV